MESRGKREGPGGFRRAESTTQTYSTLYLLSLCWKTGSLGDSRGLHIHLFVRLLFGWLVGWLNGVLQWENDQDSKGLQAERKQQNKTTAAQHINQSQYLFKFSKYQFHIAKKQTRTDSDSLASNGPVKLSGFKKTETVSDDITKQLEIQQIP